MSTKSNVKRQQPTFYQLSAKHDEGESKSTYLNERAFRLVDHSTNIHHRLRQHSMLHVLDTQCAGMDQRQCHVTWKDIQRRGRIRMSVHGCQPKVCSVARDASTVPRSSCFKRQQNSRRPTSSTGCSAGNVMGVVRWHCLQYLSI